MTMNVSKKVKMLCEIKTFLDWHEVGCVGAVSVNMDINVRKNNNGKAER